MDIVVLLMEQFLHHLRYLKAGNYHDLRAAVVQDVLLVTVLFKVLCTGPSNVFLDGLKEAVSPT